jgi:hypothetical protein
MLGGGANPYVTMLGGVMKSIAFWGECQVLFIF